MFRSVAVMTVVLSLFCLAGCQHTTIVIGVDTSWQPDERMRPDFHTKVEMKVQYQH